ncbi:phospho-N-acetylmuramoyl-pentapeptide-transferase [Advenella kashmirensis WT001]|uniref:Phospho-N-acetylmuramoyl-pentapeptide-transferase n=1 Tax=Advenella kashmirensis (strain DSM 17095 / LMG 22695 / WT001) TaxID=1036672 RepID=I3UEZ2_ADVKW|nr:phospho-N-acetylmuramoyl-pentapeptide-transferase [Advenella kashmirensis WT001]
MLYELTRWLSPTFSVLSVFEYITLRAMFACATALFIGLMAGPHVIRKLTELKIGQAVRSYGPETHLVKNGTPTMGGALILIAIGVTTLLWADLSNRFVWVVLLVTFGFGAIGWVDDYRKVVHRNPEGMSSREKFMWQAIIGLIASVYLTFAVSAPANADIFRLMWAWISSGFTMPLPSRADLIVPFFKSVSYPLGVFGFVILTWMVIVGASNAVNLTDGLDGLAIMQPSWLVARWAFLPTWLAAWIIRNTCCFRIFQAPPRCWCCAQHWAAPAWPFYGSTPTRPRCSWATWARWRWAACWAQSP